MHTGGVLSSFFVERIQEDQDICLHSLLYEMCRTYHLENVTYFGLNLPGRDAEEHVLHTTYPEKWVSHYFSHSYERIDPILSNSIRSLLPLNWSSIAVEDQAIEVFFNEASDFGIGRYGITVPVRGVYGDICLFSINASAGDFKSDALDADELSDITYLAFLYHNKIVNQQIGQSVTIAFALSRREQDVLRWAARGKSAWETAKILNLSEKTVTFYLANASSKLGVANKTQAVAKSLEENLLFF